MLINKTQTIMATTIHAKSQADADYIRNYLYEEDDELFYDKEDQLSYQRYADLPYVEVKVDGFMVCMMEVWNDSSNEEDPEREYITINHTIRYLDEMTEE